jgi:charged multivesicular body protein 6
MGCESSNEKRHLKNSAQKTVVQLSPTERAILDCKSCRDKIKRYIKNLEQKEQRSKLKVKELLRLKQRDRAKLYLKQSKLFSEQTKIADGQLDMINQQIANIESTSNMNECAEVLNRGNAVLKQLQNEVNIEHWENIKDDLDELKERDREIGDFFKEKGIDEEELETQCDDEINKLLAEMQGNDIQLPNVPKEQIPQDTNENDIKNKNKVKNKSKNKNKVIVE